MARQLSDRRCCAAVKVLAEWSAVWPEDWVIVRVPHLLDILKERGVPRTASHRTLPNIIDEYSSVVAAVLVAERMLTWATPMRTVRRNYIKGNRGGWVSHIKVHQSFLEMVK